MRRPFLSVVLTAAVALWWFPALAAEPWIITGDVVITEPMDVEDIIVALGGSLTVRDLPEPGLRVNGNLWAVGNASISLEEPVLESWRLEAIPRRAGHAEPIADGVSNVDEDEIAVWSGADPGLDQLLRTVLTDSLGRTLVGRVWVLGNGPRVQGSGARRSP